MIEKVIKSRTYKDSFRIENVAHLAECLPSVCEIRHLSPWEVIVFGSIVGLRPAQSMEDPILKYLTPPKINRFKCL